MKTDAHKIQNKSQKLKDCQTQYKNFTMLHMQESRQVLFLVFFFFLPFLLKVRTSDLKRNLQINRTSWNAKTNEPRDPKTTRPRNPHPFLSFHFSGVLGRGSIPLGGFQEIKESPTCRRAREMHTHDHKGRSDSSFAAEMGGCWLQPATRSNPPGGFDEKGSSSSQRSGSAMWEGERTELERDERRENRKRRALRLEEKDWDRHKNAISKMVNSPMRVSLSSLSFSL